MPKRKSFRRVATPEVQGDDSWVEVFKIKASTGFELQAMSGQLNDPDAATADPDLAKRMAMTAVQHVRTWNWVDDDDEPLPQPQELLKRKDEILEVLTMDELRVIISAFVGGEETDQGNSENGSATG